MKDSASSSFVIAGKPVSYLLLDGLAEGLDTNWIELGKILGFSKKKLQKIDRENECNMNVNEYNFARLANFIPHSQVMPRL